MRLALVSLLTIVVAATGAVRAAGHRADRAGSLPNPYLAIDNHFKLAEGRWWESVSAVDIDPDGTSVWVVDRCAADDCADSRLNPVLKFDEEGNLVRRFGERMFNLPHGLHVDRDGNVWVTDAEGPDEAAPSRRGKGHAVYKFSPDGRLLLTLGTPGVAGDGTGGLLNEPCDVATAPNGDIFVADGHSGQTPNAPPRTVARIVKFTKEGRWLKSWGRLGGEPGEFRTPHALAFDARGRLFVADRGNNRIQIFSQEGKVLGAWTQFSRVSDIFIDRNDVLYAADSESNERLNPGWTRGIRIGSAADGTVRYFIPDPAADTAGGVEGVAADVHGAVVAATVRGGALSMKKYVRPR